MAENSREETDRIWLLFFYAHTPCKHVNGSKRVKTIEPHGERRLGTQSQEEREKKKI